MTTEVEFPSMTLYGLQRSGPSSFNNNSGSGTNFSAELWQEFIGVLVKRSVALDGVMYGVSWPADDVVPPQTITYFCGLESATPIGGLETLSVEGGNYFEFRASVPADDLDSAFHQANFEAMPASGQTSRNGQHIEVYGDEYAPTSPIANFRILIPVE